MPELLKGTPGSRWAVRIAIETSGPLGSVAVARGDEVLARLFLTERRQHAARIIPAIDDVLGRAHIGLEEIEEIVVGIGPGSFTGTRVAAATAKGLSAGLGIPVSLYSSLAAAAVTGECLPTVVRGPDEAQGSEPLPAELEELGRCVLLDARGGRLYMGGYRRMMGRLVTTVEPSATTIDDFLADPPSPDTLCMGDGAVAHLEPLHAAGFAVLAPPWGLPTADGLIRLRTISNQIQIEREPSDWEPLYVRPAGAERIRAARTGEA